MINFLYNWLSQGWTTFKTIVLMAGFAIAFLLPVYVYSEFSKEPSETVQYVLLAMGITGLILAFVAFLKKALGK